MLPSRKYYLDSIFDNFMDEGTDNFDVMKCDVYEKDGVYHIEADIPGFKKDEISVDCEDGYVTISAEKNTENEEKDENKKYIKRERFYGKTVRKFYVGDVDSDKIQAEYKDGMLELVVPKEEKLPNKKSIEIK
ncbi:MAG: Hsp20/alpha crystallin family protein [Tenericutes bacterium]|nr:Hsp20/alpha crystallin family protein [Mycoplasmatota bacterium]